MLGVGSQGSRKRLRVHDDCVYAGKLPIRSTEPKIAHPTNPELMRQLTPIEHCRCKGVSEKLIEGFCATTAHELLGQSVLYEPFRAVGKLVPQCCRKFAGCGEVDVAAGGDLFSRIAA